jgi:CheY-like chemotaxis protein
MPTALSRQYHSTAPLRVLVADGDADARALYRTALELAGWGVLEACDGRDALRAALVEQPAVVVTELSLSFLNGFALCEILRRDRVTVNVPIVVVTSETRSTEIDRARKMADAVFTKPTPPDALLNEIERVFARSTNLRERSVSETGNAARNIQRSAALDGRAAELRRVTSSKAHARFATTTPPLAPPALTCPSCDRPLLYELSHSGGVSELHSEQWDYFNCSTCGAFQYRQRTRKLRPLCDDESQWMDELRKRQGRENTDGN